MSDYNGTLISSYVDCTKRLTVTPIAVTSAPAPAPWMIRGRGEYLLVVKEMMLSDPLRAVAKAWSAGYLIHAPSVSVLHPTPLKGKSNSLAQLGLNLARLDVNHTNIPHNLALLLCLLPEDGKELVALLKSFEVLLLSRSVG